MQQLLEKYSEQIKKAKELHDKYEQYLPAGFFTAGFLLDVLTLGEVDDLSNILILAAYLIICICILAIEFMEVDHKQFKNKWVDLAFKYRDDIFHFFLGALLSVFTLFYFKSGSLSNSFIFMLIMISLLLLNEMERFQKIGKVIRSSIVMLCLISYLIYIIPILAGKTSFIIFIVCIVLAVFISVGFFILLTVYNDKKDQNIKELLAPQVCVALGFLSLYGIKVLPPVPLSLKYIGIFHSVEKKDGNYITKDLNPWWKFWSNGDQSFTSRKGDRIYMFTKIFSPGGFSGKVYIHWLQDTDDGFKTSDRIPLNFTGGRSEGFRGYAYKSNYTPGSWQIRVETEQGLEIGRINFDVEKDNGQEEREFNIVKR